jgi:hypothetical protein
LSNFPNQHLSLSRTGHIKTAKNENEFIGVFDLPNKDISEYRSKLQGSLGRLKSLLN